MLEAPLLLSGVSQLCLAPEWAVLFQHFKSIATQRVEDNLYHLKEASSTHEVSANSADLKQQTA